MGGVHDAYEEHINQKLRKPLRLTRFSPIHEDERRYKSESTHSAQSCITHRDKRFNKVLMKLFEYTKSIHIYISTDLDRDLIRSTSKPVALHRLPRPLWEGPTGNLNLLMRAAIDPSATAKTRAPMPDAQHDRIYVSVLRPSESWTSWKPFFLHLILKPNLPEDFRVLARGLIYAEFILTDAVRGTKPRTSKKVLDWRIEAYSDVHYCVDVLMSMFPAILKAIESFVDRDKTQRHCVDIAEPDIRWDQVAAMHMWVQSSLERTRQRLDEKVKALG